MLLAAPAAAAPPELIFAGKPATREPTQYGDELGWYHIVVDANQQHPVFVAAACATLAAGGGDRLDPGSAADIRAPGICADASDQGGLPTFSIELRHSASGVDVDPLGQLSAIASVKARHPLHVTPGMWHVVASGVSGMTEWVLRAEGGTIWVGSHMATKYTTGPNAGEWRPPSDPDPCCGAAWPLHWSDEPLHLPGNQAIYAWSDTQGAILHMLKIERGRGH